MKNEYFEELRMCLHEQGYSVDICGIICFNLVDADMCIDLANEMYEEDKDKDEEYRV